MEQETALQIINRRIDGIKAKFHAEPAPYRTPKARSMTSKQYNAELEYLYAAKKDVEKNG